MSGLFITVEGIEGAGKTTIARRIIDWLEHAGHDCVYTREPGSTSAGEHIRSLLLNGDIQLSAESEVLLFEAARIQLMDEIILPALAEERVVVLDRFYDSTTAYQGYGRGLPLDWIQQMNLFACRYRKPDITILLDIDAETGLHRARETKQDQIDNDRFEKEAIEFMKKIRKGFLTIAKNESERIHCVPVDGSIETVWQNALEIVSKNVSRFIS